MQKYLANYDDSYIHVVDEYLVDKINHFTIDSYLFGRCHLFAQALHEAKGFQIGLFVTMGEVAFAKAPCLLLVHAFCYLNNDEVIDAKGIRTKQDMLMRYDTGEEVFELSGDEALVALKQMDLFDYDSEGERRALMRHINQMQHHGLLKPGQLEKEIYVHSRFF